MRKDLPKLLITGGAGFIGSEFTRLAVAKNYPAVVLDKLTYAGDLKRLAEVKTKIKFYKADICNKKGLGQIFKIENPDIVINFAAESHVDRSIQSSEDFTKTNVYGTQVLLDIARYRRLKTFVHISTDEVYGEIERGSFFEDSPVRPNSPYSATKAAADFLVQAYRRTFNLPTIILRPSNNYGPWQYPEKFIPVVIYNALHNHKIPVYGKGINVREWLYVWDCAQAILKAMEDGEPGEIYNIGSGEELKNTDVVKKILTLLDKPSSLIEFIHDRPGHDIRYRLDSSKITRKLKWHPKVDFDTGIVKTLAWYRQHIAWLKSKTKYLQSYWRKVYKYDA